MIDPPRQARRGSSMRISRLVLSLSTVLLGATGVRAQGRIAWNDAPTVGSWAEFDMTVVKDGKTSSGSYRLACLEKRRFEGVDYLWCEIARANEGKKPRIFKVLIPQDSIASSDKPLSQARQVVYQDGDKVPMMAEGSTLASVVEILDAIQGDVPLTYESSGRDEVKLPEGKSVTAFRKVGTVEITPPGQEKTKVTSEVWVIRDVPFGFVKRVITTESGSGATGSKSVETIVLRREGSTGATSQITGTPKPFNALDLLLGGRG